MVVLPLQLRGHKAGPGQTPPGATGTRGSGYAGRPAISANRTPAAFEPGRTRGRRGKLSVGVVKSGWRTFAADSRGFSRAPNIISHARGVVPRPPCRDP